MLKILAVWLGKMLTLLGKLMGKMSSSAPGEYALKICPSLVNGLNNSVRKGIIVTCGTNGKTTTNNLICSVLEKKGYKVLCNRLGANMLSGVATAMLDEMNIFGKLMVDYACLEIDEAYAPIVFDKIKPDVMIVTNLFRDQLDRYGETDITSELLTKAIKKADGVKLILNGDDPLCAQFGLIDGVNAKYYGVSEKVTDEENTSKEGRRCPICRNELNYSLSHYSQLGIYDCSGCSFKRPEINYNITDVSLDTPMRFKVNGKETEVNYKGFYNIYNIASVYAALDVLGEETDNFTELLAGYKPQIGRMQEFNFNKPVILSLSKNPAGFNQAISTLNCDKRKKDIIIAVNDKVSDGRDVSWLWDVDFEKLNNENLNFLAVTGMRVYDVALRFKYDNIDADMVTTSMKEAIIKSLSTDSEVTYVIVNYTALFPTEKILNNLLKEGGTQK